jgi:hypothetical protein
VLLALVLVASPARADEWRDHGFGGPTVRALGGVTPGASRLLGLGGGFRIHGAPALALEVGYDQVDGRSPGGLRGRDRALGLYALVYPRPGGRTQPYFLGGFGYAWQDASRHAAAWLGGGFEWFASSDAAIGCDVRAFFRAGADDETLPFVRAPFSGANAGLLFTLGGQLYIFGK